MKRLNAIILSICLASAAAVTSSIYVLNASHVGSLKGDVNGDGVVNATDFLLGLKYSQDDTKYNETTPIDENEEQTAVVGDFKNNADDFEIEDGVLLGYYGTDEIVRIPDNVTEIADNAFWSNPNILAVYIPGTVKKVGDHVFWSCDALEFLDIAEGVKHIGMDITWSCPSLKDINFPSTIELPEKLELKNLRDFYFSNCPKLTVHLSGIEEGQNTDSDKQSSEYGEKATYDFKPVTYVASDRSKMILPGAYAYGTFEEFTIPEGTDSIGACAFNYCEQLKSITIPGSVKTVGVDAFEYCYALTDVYICEGCETLECDAFEYCESLKEVTLPASITYIHKEAFEYTSKSLTIHCPKGS
ncbi:MAG: leucine-rich repeat protein, partial [Lachnospiraceae bacterium]|nr:leucine-rich repeat protein [Lachnospiraceae bacterium]